jgi:cytoskeletal protein CcmA (bactofilin family)
VGTGQETEAGKNMPDVPTKEEFATVIGPDAQFKGELTFQGGVRIDGQFEGTIQSAGKVFVSKAGKLKAEVKAGSIALEGHVEGNVAAEDRVELRATAQLRGDLKASKLLVVEGATFIGRCEVGPGAATGSHSRSKEEPAMRPVPTGAAARH